MTDINAFIDDKVKNNDVFLFMKGSPDFPQCGFSGQVVQILNYLGLEYGSANVLESAELRDGIKAYTNWPTIPQLYVKGEFIGGADIVRVLAPGEAVPKPPRCVSDAAPQGAAGDCVAGSAAGAGSEPVTGGGVCTDGLAASSLRCARPPNQPSFGRRRSLSAAHMGREVIPS